VQHQAKEDAHYLQGSLRCCRAHSSVTVIAAILPRLKAANVRAASNLIGNFEIRNFTYSRVYQGIRPLPVKTSEGMLLFRVMLVASSMQLQGVWGS
jgi:hypothetical protein